MNTNALQTNYNNLKEIPYLNRGGADPASYVSDLNSLKEQIGENYLNSVDVQSKLNSYFKDDLHVDELDNLEKNIANAFVENENLSREELKNKLIYAIKTDNLHKNIENNTLYNAALQSMVNEDISLDSIDIENMKQSLHNKTRSLEIRQYYDQKMKSQIVIIKIVIVVFLTLLVITLFYKMNILNTHIYIALIGIGLACIVIFTTGRLFDIFMRDNKKFDEYAFIRSHHYLNKGDEHYKKMDGLSSHQETDLISDKCLQVLNDDINDN
jgi:membrane-associated HD superfamily phosphohydrolase